MEPKELTLRQKEFCKLFASDREFFGNGTESYIQAYNVDLTRKGAYAGARASASKLLTKSNILAKINSLLESAVLNDEFVDKQMAMLISQNADFGAKMSAIKEYNALKQRIAKKLIIDDQRDTRDKIKGFLDDATDSSPSQSDAPSTEPAAEDAGAGDTEVAPAPPAVS